MWKRPVVKTRRFSISGMVYSFLFMGICLLLYITCPLISFCVGNSSRYSISDSGNSICDESNAIPETACLPPVLRILNNSYSSALQALLTALLAPEYALEYLYGSREQTHTFFS